MSFANESLSLRPAEEDPARNLNSRRFQRRLSSTEATPLLSMSVEQGEVTPSKEIPLEESSEQRDSSSLHVIQDQKKAPWWSYIWDYEPGRSHEERAFIQKLDVYLITMLSFGYFIKNLDQTNISNAFVSGMKEDLAMNGNQINLVDTAWTVGYVVGQIPSQIVLTKVRPSIWVPSCELLWTVLTFCLAAAKTSDHVIAIRFFVGLAESIFYPAAHTILGSWYKPSELGKRACIFHASSAAASMFSGYLQAGVYRGLNGVHGLPGWKWLFVSSKARNSLEESKLNRFYLDHGWRNKFANLSRWVLLTARSAREHESVLPERE